MTTKDKKSFCGWVGIVVGKERERKKEIDERNWILGSENIRIFIRIFERGSYYSTTTNQPNTTQPLCSRWIPDWSHDSTYVVSGGFDENIFVWSTLKKTKRIQFKFAHKGGVTAARWTGTDRTLVTAGNDGVLLKWNIGEEMKAKFGC